MTKKDKAIILEEAYKKYTVGTKFYCAHLESKKLCIVSEGQKLYWEADDSDVLMFSSGDDEKNGHFYSEIVYYLGSWAEIEFQPLCPQIINNLNQIENKLEESGRNRLEDYKKR